MKMGERSFFLYAPVHQTWEIFSISELETGHHKAGIFHHHNTIKKWRGEVIAEHEIVMSAFRKCSLFVKGLSESYSKGAGGVHCFEVQVFLSSIAHLCQLIDVVGRMWLERYSK